MYRNLYQTCMCCICGFDAMRLGEVLFFVFFSKIVLAKEENTARSEHESDPTAGPPQSSEGTGKGVVVPPGSLDLLCRLFPEKKRSVLELVLRRCEHDLLKAIEHCVPLCKTLASAPKSRKSSSAGTRFIRTINRPT